MQNKNLKAVIMIAGGILGLCLYFAACSGDGPVGPTEPKDYVVYFHDGASYFNVFYGYHTLTGALDSFTLPGELWKLMAVSADGKSLYLPEANSVAVADLDSKEIVANLPYKAHGGVAVSPDGQLIAVLGDDLHILKTSDYSAVFHDTDLVSHGRFSADSRSFYCGSGGEVTRRAAYKVALDSGFAVTRRSFSDGTLTSIIPSIDQSRWFLYLYAGGGLSWFEVYDVAADSIVYRDFLICGTGELELTPDGRYVFYTHPGSMLYGCPDPTSFSTFSVFDAERNEIHKVIKTFMIDDSGDTVPVLPVRELAITPDGRWLVSAGVEGGLGLNVMDVQKMEIERCVFLGYSKSVWYLTCQNSL